MTKLLATAAAALLVGSMAFSQTSLAQTTQGSGDASKDLTNCPPSTTGQAAAGSTGASENAKAVEKSAILPAAENHTQSAAPTVQRDGQSVEARADCPQDAGQPKPKD